MKKSLCAWGVVALLSGMGGGVAQAGLALPTHPSPPWPGVYAAFTGPVTVTQGATTFTCTWTLKIMNVETPPSAPVPHGDVPEVINGSASGGLLCGTMSFGILPWAVSANSMTSFTIRGMNLTTALGACGSGSITTSWANGPPPVIAFTSQVVGSCTVTGTLTQTNTPYLAFY